MLLRHPLKVMPLTTYSGQFLCRRKANGHRLRVLYKWLITNLARLPNRQSICGYFIHLNSCLRWDCPHYTAHMSTVWLEFWLPDWQVGYLLSTAWNISHDITFSASSTTRVDGTDSVLCFTPIDLNFMTLNLAIRMVFNLCTVSFDSLKGTVLPLSYFPSFFSFTRVFHCFAFQPLVVSQRQNAMQ